MSVNGVTSNQVSDTYSTAYAAAAPKTNDKTDKTANTAVKDGVVYEPSKNTTKKYEKNTELIAKLKADAEEKTSQFRSLVEQMMSKQGATIGKSDDMWRFLAGGNFTVTADVKAKAQADIAEDGYWGVNQTSDRIVDFAKALSGGNPDKLEEMKKAFEKGFKQATKTWGGKLPDISQKTYQAVLDKFDKWESES